MSRGQRSALVWRRFYLGAFAGLVAALVCATPAAAQSSSDTEIVSVRVGFDGVYKVGHWTPVEVTLRGGAQAVAGQLHLVVCDGDGVPTRISSHPSRPVQTLPGQTSTALLYVKFGQSGDDLDVEFSTLEGETIAERTFPCELEPSGQAIPFPLAATDELMVTIGGDIGLATATRAAAAGSRLQIVQLNGTNQLPTRWFGYEAVDTLVLATSDPAAYRKLAPTGAQAEALVQWVRLGGKVLLVIGSSAPEILSAESALAVLAPGRFEAMVPLRRSASLEAYSGGENRIHTGGNRFLVEVPRLVEIAGTIEAYEGEDSRNLPLVVRSTHGFGEVTTVLVDLDRPPFSGWPGRAQMVQRLLMRVPREARGSEEDTTSQVTGMMGYQELTGQLRSALDQFRGVKLVPFWIVAVAVCVYILWIGPIDYWLVRHVFKRMELTWVTFPLSVVVVSVGAYYLAFWLKGNDLRTNQVELVDVDLETGLVRGTTWTNLFSPRPDSYNLTMRPVLPGGDTPESPPQLLLSWMGLPGAGLGGMNSRATNSPLFRRPYDFSPDLGALEGVPIQVWSTKSLTSRWVAQGEFPLQVQLAEHEDQMLEGSLTSQLGLDIIDARLFYDRWVYTLGGLKDGQRVAVNERLQPQHSKTMLTQQHITGDREKITLYDTESFDVPRIMDIMMFHSMAGGDAYTLLGNRYQKYCDLSDPLRNGRAILLLRVRNPGSELVRDDVPIDGKYDQRWTFYRFLLPVERNTP